MSPQWQKVATVGVSEYEAEDEYSVTTLAEDSRSTISKGGFRVYIHDNCEGDSQPFNVFSFDKKKESKVRRSLVQHFLDSDANNILRPLTGEAFHWPGPSFFRKRRYNPDLGHDEKDFQ